jgi:polysaccharide pyruvyl transferase WcaK-like protein
MKAVVLNDTSRERHHGCSRVMENLYRELSQHGIDVSAISHLNGDLDSPSLLAELNKSDLAIINGEGTIHHGSSYAESMLELVANSTAKRKVLLNSTYDSNPEHYRNYLAKFDDIFVRDQRSRAELSAIGIASTLVPDMTFLSQRDPNTETRPQVIIGGSVDREVSVQLFRLGRILGQTARPLSIFQRNDSTFNRAWEIRKSVAVKDLLTPIIMFRIIQARRWFTRNACLHHEDYSAQIANSTFLISGRYHAICMAIKTRTPFWAIESNTFKISALLKDIGIENRSVSKTAFLAGTEVEQAPFSQSELERIASFEQQAKDGFRDMFERIFGYE